MGGGGGEDGRGDQAWLIKGITNDEANCLTDYWTFFAAYGDCLKYCKIKTFSNSRKSLMDGKRLLINRIM